MGRQYLGYYTEIDAYLDAITHILFGISLQLKFLDHEDIQKYKNEINQKSVVEI